MPTRSARPAVPAIGVGLPGLDQLATSGPPGLGAAAGAAERLVLAPTGTDWLRQCELIAEAHALLPPSRPLTG
jgi:hypothetical protein